jgi:hypothetical protein
MVGRSALTRILVSGAIAGGVIVGAIVTGGGGGGGGTSAFPNTSGANVFIAATGNDAGTNCVRNATPVTTPPTASTACATAAKAYELMHNGDTAWFLPGSYGTTHAVDFEVNTPAVFHTSVGNNCQATNQCFYFIPQPGQESSVNVGGTPTAMDGDGYPAFHQSRTPDNLYYGGFRGAKGCPSFSNTSYGTTTGFAKDITVVNGQGTNCTLYMVGPWSYVNIIGQESSFNCNDSAQQAGGSVFPAANQSSGNDGVTSDHIYAPHDITVTRGYFHDYVINGCGPANPHMDCFHPRSGYNITFSYNKFDNCFDSSILFEGLAEPGFSENNKIIGNWFGPTQLGANNCCLRGASGAAGDPCSNETFDDYIIAFNTSTSVINNKACNVMNNVRYVGNIAMSTNVCAGGIWSYNLLGGSACGVTDAGSVTNSQVKLIDMNNGTLNLHIQTGSIAEAFVPGLEANGCSLFNTDFDGNSRSAPCDAGSDELP